MPRTRLRPLSRIFFVGLNAALGLIPSAMFFIWIERNCALPWIAIKLEWPWISLSTLPEFSGTGFLVAFDFALILAFGLIHSVAAQKPFYRAMELVFPHQAGRALFMAMTGISALAVMGLWQNTGVLVWVLPLPALALNAFSVLFFLALMGMVAWLMLAFDASEFLGFKQIYLRHDELCPTGATRRLNRTGWYARVRHPIYFFTLLAVIVTPWMSLDRLTVFAGFLVYLSFGIPLEERKLRTIFGTDYEEYQRQIPAFFPRF